jgi:DNA-binding SARP family transcriptional activator
MVRGGRVEFRVLGPVELWAGEQKVELGRAKERCLLGVLLLSAGRPVTTRTLLEALWDDLPPEQARKSIQAYVSRLRRVLRQVGSATQIATRHDSYTLLPGGDVIDYLKFKMLLNQGRSRRRESRLDASAHVLYEAISLWEGPPIADLRTGWMERRREDLESYDQLAAYQELCDVQLERGNYQDALQLLEEAMQGHELDTKYIGQRLTALDGAGHYAEFDAYWLRIYHQTVESFGTGPARELQDLHGRLLENRDGLVPWRHAHPALAEIRRPPAQLPAAINEFVGRKDELDRLDQLLMRSRMAGQAGTLVMAVTGPLGIGKTELALRWAHGVKEQFPYGQLYADLAGYSAGGPADPTEILADFLLALDVPRFEIPDSPAARGALFRTILNDRDALLLLDNARDSEQIRPLLPGNRRCVVVVTSRHRLTDLVTRHGAYRTSLARLSPEESALLVQGMLLRVGLRPSEFLLDALVALSAGTPQIARNAVDLVIRRFEMTLSGRALSESDIPSMDEILDHGEGDNDSLISSLMWSCRSLPENAVRTFVALARCPCSDLGENALLALSKSVGNHVDGSLDALTAVHLLAFDDGRYKIQEMYRRFGRRRGGEFLLDGEFLSSMIELAAWYERALSRASAILFVRRVDMNLPAGDSFDFSDRTSAGSWLADELENILALVRLLAELRQAHAWRLSTILRDYLGVRRLWGEWKQVHEWGLAAAEASNVVDAQVDMLNGLALVSEKMGRFEEGLGYSGRALACQEPDSRSSRQAESLRIRALLHRGAGRNDLAYADCVRAVALAESGDRHQLASAFYDLSVVCADLGHLDESIEVLRRTLSIRDDLDDHVGRSAAMSRLAQHCHWQGDDDEAAEFCNRVLALRHNEALGYADSLLALVVLAEISCDRQEFDRALDYARQALILCHTPEDHQLAARAMVCHVSGLVGAGRLDEAGTEAKHAIVLIADIDHRKVAEIREKFKALGVLGS